MWSVKVGDEKNLTFWIRGYVLLSKFDPASQVFWPPTLTSHSFAVPWAMMMKSGSFENPMSYLLALNLKDCIEPLLASVRTSWRVPIYYITRGLLILKCSTLKRNYLLSFLLVIAFAIVLKKSTFPLVSPFLAKASLIATSTVFILNPFSIRLCVCD